jgi:hypothetical protein
MVSHKCEHSKKIKVAQSGFSHRLAGDTVSSYRKLPPRAVEGPAAIVGHCWRVSQDLSGETSYKLTPDPLR